jgi:hypothetical protein
MALSSDVGSDGMEALINGEESWESPEVVSALEFWANANDAGFLPRSPTSVDYDNSAALFYSGDAAMIPTGSWLVGEIDDNVNFDVGYIPFPAPDGPGNLHRRLGSGPYISAGTDKTEAAVEFLDFLRRRSTVAGRSRCCTPFRRSRSTPRGWTSPPERTGGRGHGGLLRGRRLRLQHRRHDHRCVQRGDVQRAFSPC